VISTVRPISDAITASFSGEEMADSITFRCEKRLAVALRRRALIEQVELSSLVRQLLREAADARGIDLSV
jgi:predicted HicB family RNase H-like nuclease